MREENKFQMLRQYIYQYRYIIGVYLGFMVIFYILFSVYDLEKEAFLYGVILCTVLALCFIVAHFYLFCIQHQHRKELQTNILIINELPEPKSMEERDYLEIIQELKGIYASSLTKWQNERNDSIDYYTTWVHQIKTPISVMDMILQSEDTDEHRELGAELFRVEQYVEMVLSYFRLDSNSTDFVFREVDLDDIIKQAIRKYAPQFVRKRIALRYEPVHERIVTDEKWLTFIMEQLLSNAIKYTLKGSVTISITRDQVLRISDTGIGIAKEDIPRIFDKGFTGYNGRANKKSTGLGLYLCKQAAMKLSHNIIVESEVGKGTTVLLDLYHEPLFVE